MTDSTDNRYLRGCHSTYCDLLVECPQILHRTAAAAHNKYVGQLMLVEELDGLRHLLRRALALHLHGIKQKLNSVIASARHCNDVTHSRPRRRSHNTDSARIHRQRLLTLRSKKTGLLQLTLKLLIGLHQIALALLQQHIRIKLVHAVTLIHSNAAYSDDRLAILRLKAQTKSTALEHHALHSAACILERKIAMT